MKQLIQHLGTGETQLEEVPAPALQPGHILIRTSCSLISAGTEKMLVEFSKANLITKARKNPDRVAQVLDKIKTDGLLPTLEAVFKRLDEPLPLGYCNAGVVIGVAEDVIEFKVGDRVASNGMHAVIVSVPKNLAAKIPDQVSDEEAAFTVIGAIGLQSIRLAQPQIGETVVVIGLGLVGLITSQLLIANGCRVIGFDIDAKKVELARALNMDAHDSTATDPVRFIENTTGMNGADAVIIAASAKNDSIIQTAARLSRKRGRIILVGVTDMQLDRSEFYKKELSFQVSCSYGPGRYDASYEEKGNDYPAAFVRWTAKRNFEAVLHCMENKQVQVLPLISAKVDFENAIGAYNTISDPSNIATLLMYSSNTGLERLIKTGLISKPSSQKIAVIGAGNFTRMTLLPALEKCDVSVKYISSGDGLNAALLAKKFRIPNAVTDNSIALDDPEISTVIITTRHDTHASIAAAAINKGKHVFIEKPIALNTAQLELIENATARHPELQVFAGFNRRFSPLAQKAKSLLQNADDLNIIMTINAGRLPSDHWLLDPVSGGGRIIGEACHFFDLMSFFTGSEIVSVYATDSGKSGSEENTIIHLRYRNGTHGVINYFANGNRAFPKEKIEIFTANRVLVLDNFKKLIGYGFNNFSEMTVIQNKGHVDQFKAVTDIIKKGGQAPVSLASLLNTTRATFAAVKSIRENKIIETEA